MSEARAAFRVSLPVLFGYLPLGMAFGVLFASLDLGWVLAVVAGVIVYAGAAQFMAVGLLAAGASLPDVFVSTLLMNARHLVYGLSVLGRYPQSGALKWYLIFGLTDETYSLVTSRPVPESLNRHAFYGWLTALNQAYWVLGCGLGAFLGSAFAIKVSGLEFTLVALFVVLLMEQWAQIRRFEPLMVAAVLSLIAFWVAADQFLILALSSTVVVLGWLVRREDRWINAKS
ncbi:MAG: branched-chain amino acid ABC transporter permease [Gammaproteobacteria bacterium]|nr:branched-chain amino acid ABC transporter permease [Gammaproteobacteria bacterium]